MVVENGVVAPVGLALDWLHDRLYWGDEDKQLIESISLNGSLRAVVVWKGLGKPRDIAVYPEKGYVYDTYDIP